MEIKDLKKLVEHPTFRKEGSDYVKVLEPISVTEVVSLENIYNSGQQFPVALRELLLLAGNDCYVLDYGLNDSQAEMQGSSRAYLTSFGRNYCITRPFFVIDVYNAGTQFLFVYLDEDQEDPIVYEAYMDEAYPNWIESVGGTLSSLIKHRMVRLLSGRNPF
ncbi:hypothetical protein [Mucilaginibacter myungsuensis]|uniref:SMI1/KNR4 family protein n=1 Tax=Mucilaginibacter myungsuensis TaxID=649104 RepID=A0A929KY86_9SPHI|nr:hypothetical protein [Mucilaginibacter myungsuensis]MBE9662123.1 hypothetical protein [Mucilaginibacter myungsuensis]MDN3599443.1 hypothetical protein [Mucilaginibacter myungsuensis]